MPAMTVVSPTTTTKATGAYQAGQRGADTEVDAEPEEQRHQPGAAGVGRERQPGNLGAIEEPDVVRAAVADDPQLLLTLQQ